VKVKLPKNEKLPPLPAEGTSRLAEGVEPDFEAKIRAKLRLMYSIVNSPLFFEKVAFKIADGTIFKGAELDKVTPQGIADKYEGMDACILVVVAFSDGTLGKSSSTISRLKV